MDVRCESCQTVYEFDEARVKDSGTTVKCTQCGHIFKVRKRVPGQRGPSTLPGLAPVSDGGGPLAEPAPPTLPAPHAPAPTPTGGRLPTTTQVVMATVGGDAVAAAPSGLSASDSSPDRMWMLRRATSGEVHRFRDLTTLQQWIVEMKAGRDDEISRNGDRWKRIGGIAELEPFFRVVEQAQGQAAAVPTRVARQVDQVERHPSNPRMEVARPPSNPQLPVAARDDYAAAGASAVSYPPRPVASSYPPRPADAELRDAVRVDDDERGVSSPDLALPRRGPSPTALVAVASVLVLVGVTGYLAVFQRGALRSMVGADEGARGREALRKGREYFLLDTDDDFQHADQQFQRAQGADETNPQPVAALVELNTTWARHLRDDAQLAEVEGPARATELRQRAQARFDEAKRYAAEARSLAQTDPVVSRALADFLVLDGAPAAQVQEALGRAEAARRDDPEARYVRGVLALRDGRPDEAQALLEQADRLNQSLTQHDLLRAGYQLAMLHAQAGRVAEARAAARRILDGNPHHARANALLAWLDRAPAAPTPSPTPTAAPPQAAAGPAAPAASPVAGAAAAPVVTALAPPPAATPGAPAVPAAPAPSRPAAAESEREPRGYAALVASGNDLLERGKGKEAVKAFQKALAEQPGGVEAMIGMAWAYLDTEHHNAAADKFKEVLAVLPNNGEAIIGLAQTYKVRGEKRQALQWYKKYIEELPRGSKTQMAQANVRELEAALAHEDRAASPPPPAAPAPSPPAPAPSPPAPAREPTPAAPPATP